MRKFLLLAFVFGLQTSHAAPPPEDRQAKLPEELRGWVPWVQWDQPHLNSPRPFDAPDTRLPVWPGRLELVLTAQGGTFSFAVQVFDPAWVPLPGGEEQWPLGVTTGSERRPVVARKGQPGVELPAGLHLLQGRFQWPNLPSQLRLPELVGVLSLNLEGQPITAPTWEAGGMLFLKREGAAPATEKPFLEVKVYGLLEDGIPLQLHRQVDLIVAGPSREETLGSILPAGWRLSSVSCPLPVAVDDLGRVKVQVRAGQWRLEATAFRTDPAPAYAYPAEAPAARPEEFLAFRANPELRQAEITGATLVDVSQTTFPGAWRNLPVYRWENRQPLRLEERARGAAQSKPAGLRIARRWWLDDDGRAFTFQDLLLGEAQQIWRLEAASGQELGAVRSGEAGQLITRQPGASTAGVEVRTRTLNLTATGRMARTGALSATGWQQDAESLQVSLHLPPGWRLLALFGADQTTGDWLTAWTLLDVFLLLLFTVAVRRLFGWVAATLAVLTFLLVYQGGEFLMWWWLGLLAPVALLRLAPAGRLHTVMRTLLMGLGGLWLLFFAGYAFQQLQAAIYPQLAVEDYGAVTMESTDFASEAGLVVDRSAQAPAVTLIPGLDPIPDGDATKGGGGRWRGFNDNLKYEAKARIQTGPAVPAWHGRVIEANWHGPVQAGQQVSLWLIPPWLERLLSLLRVALPLALAAGTWLRLLVLGRPLSFSIRVFKRAAVTLVLLFEAANLGASQEPCVATLQQLRERLQAAPEAFPQAAELAHVTLKLEGPRMLMEAEVHVAAACAVPLPGRLPTWSPVRVAVPGQPDPPLLRREGFLWVYLPAGVHTVQVEGLLAGGTEWEWSYRLKPHAVTIQAPGWTITGVRPSGAPENQVFFVQEQKSTPGAATYERQEVQSLVVVERQLELGLEWRVQTRVRRLTSPGKALNLRVPLLPGENVLADADRVKEGFMEVRLEAQVAEATWASNLVPTRELRLATRPTDTWVEQWHLVAAPTWHVEAAGPPPVFESGSANLEPVWHPWPGESVTLAIARPEAVPGATITVQQARHEVSLGQRQRTNVLTLSLRGSLGEDLALELPPAAEVTSVKETGKTLPLRQTGARVLLPIHPGEQNLEVAWREPLPLGWKAVVAAVQLPVETANARTHVEVPASRWILWAGGPRLGPAVRFWSVLAFALLAAWGLARTGLAPLRGWEWLLLMVGLSQLSLWLAAVVVGWLFLLARRERTPPSVSVLCFNVGQVLLVALTLAAVVILLVTAAHGLLGAPRMYITGDYPYRLEWYQARSGTTLPQPVVWSVSIWWYRLLMLGWSLWLASALLRWLRWGWMAFSQSGVWRAGSAAKPVPPPPTKPVPPPLPPQP